MKFPPTIGSIQPVDRQHYDDLVGQYVEQVSQVAGVLSIVLFGSVSTPGLSDVDLVVTVSDHGPWPDWQDISLRRFAHGHPAQSVVAHEIFVWPESVAKSAESFFYIDQQSVLYGSPLGGETDPAMKNAFSQLLAMDYLIHRFEALSSLLTQPQITLRAVLLFISTLRHTCQLAAELEVLCRADADGMIADIGVLRATVVEQGFRHELLDGWPERIIRLLWSVAIGLGNQLGLENQRVEVRKWRSGPRQIFLNSDSADGFNHWQECIGRQSNRWFAKYVRAAPIPSIVFSHVQKYHNPDSESGAYLAKHFPNIFGNGKNTVSPARLLRVRSVIQHWQFLRDSGYLLSSGKGYIGVGMPSPHSLKSTALRGLSAVNALRMPSFRQETEQQNSNQR